MDSQKRATPETTNWMTAPLVGFDTETTGVDVFTDRIVTASIYTSQDDRSSNVLINPGVEIPAFASAIHGITTAHARRYGGEPGPILDWLRDTLHAAWQSGTPVVGHNIVYDLSILAAELHRYGLQPLQVTGPVFDTLVLDKQVDRWRKGKRTLDVVAEVYNVTLDGAHTANADAKAACLIGQAIVAKHFPDMTAAALTEAQEKWAAQQADSLQSYFRRVGNYTIVDGRWPVCETPLSQSEQASHRQETPLKKPRSAPPATVAASSSERFRTSQSDVAAVPRIAASAPEGPGRRSGSKQARGAVLALLVLVLLVVAFAVLQ